MIQRKPALDFILSKMKKGVSAQLLYFRPYEIEHFRFIKPTTDLTPSAAAPRINLILVKAWLCSIYRLIMTKDLICTLASLQIQATCSTGYSPKGHVHEGYLAIRLYTQLHISPLSLCKVSQTLDYVKRTEYSKRRLRSASASVQIRGGRRLRRPHGGQSFTSLHTAIPGLERRSKDLMAAYPRLYT